jgi:hypothetical protein
LPGKCIVQAEYDRSHGLLQKLDWPELAVMILNPDVARPMLNPLQSLVSFNQCPEKGRADE